jgi:hypothetical protein
MLLQEISADLPANICHSFNTEVEKIAVRFSDDNKTYYTDTVKSDLINEFVRNKESLREMILNMMKKVN